MIMLIDISFVDLASKFQWAQGTDTSCGGIVFLDLSSHFLSLPQDLP
jgi:hypothetical protein